MRVMNPEHACAVMEVINRGPFFMLLAMRVTALELGRSTVTADISRSHMNPFGGVHGGVYSSVIDTAAYWSAYGDLGEDQGLVTIDLKVDLLAPVMGAKVTVTGTRIKSGRTLVLAEARMYDESGKSLAHGTSKLMVTQNKQTMGDVTAYVNAGPLPRKFIRSTHAV